MRFNSDMYDKIYPRQEPKVIDDIPAEDKMVEEVDVEEKKVVTDPKPTEEDDNGVPRPDEPVTE